jgi:hypothetical protein
MWEPCWPGWGEWMNPTFCFIMGHFISSSVVLSIIYEQCSFRICSCPRRMMVLPVLLEMLLILLSSKLLFISSWLVLLKHSSEYLNILALSFLVYGIFLEGKTVSWYLKPKWTARILCLDQLQVFLPLWQFVYFTSINLSVHCHWSQPKGRCLMGQVGEELQKAARQVLHDLWRENVY